jgi:hypothetical protein
VAGFREWWASRRRIRPTSVTTPFVGMAWELGPSSRVVLEQLVTFLDDRRVLVALLGQEHNTYVRKSVQAVRARIEHDREQLPVESQAHAILGELLKACRRYLTVAEGLGQQQTAPARVSDWEAAALIGLRKVFTDELPKLRGIVHVQLIDEVVAKVALGYMIPAFEYEMLNALGSPGSWRAVHAFIPGQHGTPRELSNVLGYVRVDEDLAADGKVVTRWLGVPPEWPLTQKQPHNWHELLFEACFDQSADAEEPSFTSERIPDPIGIGSPGLSMFRQILLTTT